MMAQQAQTNNLKIWNEYEKNITKEFSNPWMH
jgi:hypothetical protein